MIVIVTPLQSELAGALRELAGARPEALEAPEPGALFQAGPERVLGWTGVGRGPTERLLERVAALRPARVLHLGVAGALQPGLAAGDALVIERVLRGGEPDQTLTPDPEWLARWERSDPGLRRGGCLTVDAIADTPARKAELGRAHPGAAVVEMETWWAAAAARGLGLELTCVRVVIDRLEQHLPDLSPALDAVGRPRPLAFARHLLRRPRAIAKLPALASAFQTAERRLRGLIRDAAQAS